MQKSRQIQRVRCYSLTLPRFRCRFDSDRPLHKINQLRYLLIFHIFQNAVESAVGTRSGGVSVSIEPPREIAKCGQFNMLRFGAFWRRMSLPSVLNLPRVPVWIRTLMLSRGDKSTNLSRGTIVRYDEFRDQLEAALQRNSLHIPWPPTCRDHRAREHRAALEGLCPRSRTSEHRALPRLG